MQELNDYLDRVTHLPPAPRILPQLMTLLSRTDVDCDEVVRIINFDASLTASVIRLCNSAFFSAANPAGDLHEAVTRLGFRQVFQLVATVVSARSLTPRQKGYGIDEGELWRHSVTTAVAAEILAKDRHEDDVGMVFTAALLHDIGKIVLSEALEHIYAKLIEEIESHQQSLLEAEKRLLGVQHAEIGGQLLARWQFPAQLVAAVWFHHQPDAAKGHERLAAYVYLGNMIAYFLGHGYGHQAFAMRGRKEALDIIQCRSDDLPGYMIQTLESQEAIEAFLNVRR